jgi:hypothetical protein
VSARVARPAASSEGEASGGTTAGNGATSSSSSSKSGSSLGSSSRLPRRRNRGRGPTTDYWSAFAANHDVTVIYHVLEVDGDDFYNAVGIVDASGFVDRYRKRLLDYDGDYYDDYLALGVTRIINVMDWDDDPNGPAAAIDWFRDRANNNGVEIFAADVSTWDGTGRYRPGDVPRERIGLPAIAIGMDGVSVHPLAAE